MPPKKKGYLSLTIVIFASVVGSLWVIARVSMPVKEPKNDIESWTQGYLRQGAYLKVEINSGPPMSSKEVIFWIVHSNETTMISVGVIQKMLGSPLIPYPVVEVIGSEMYREEQFYIFPYTINIPSAKEHFREQEGGAVEWKILDEEKGWDTWYFKFAKYVNGTMVRKEEWLIDADSHLAEYIHIEIAGDPTQVTTISVLEHSGGLRSTDEIHVLSIAAGLLSLFIVPITLWEIATIGQKKEAEHLVSREKKRLRSKTYREQYLKQRGEKENDVDITNNMNETEETERRGLTDEEVQLFERSAFIFGGGLLSFLANWIIKGRHYPMWQGIFSLLSVSILFTGLTLASIHLSSLLIKKVLIKIRSKQLDKRRKPTH